MYASASSIQIYASHAHLRIDKSIGRRARPFELRQQMICVSANELPLSLEATIIIMLSQFDGRGHPAHRFVDPEGGHGMRISGSTMLMRYIGFNRRREDRCGPA